MKHENVLYFLYLCVPLRMEMPKNEADRDFLSFDSFRGIRRKTEYVHTRSLYDRVHSIIE